MKTLSWSIRRELWENRSIWIAPTAVAILIVAASVVGTVTLPGRLHGLSFVDPVQQHKVVEEPFTFAALLIMFVSAVVGVYYCVDAFQSERRDRSILFWKSMPVPDVTTGLAKASIPLLVLPLVTFGVTVATHAVMLLFGSLRLLAAGQSPSVLWSHLSFVRMSVLLLYHLVFVHALWWAPFWGWLLLASAWARRAAFLWATLPPLAVGMLERIAFGTTRFASLLERRFMGGPEGGPPAPGAPMTMASMTPSNPLDYLTNPAFWGGLILAAVFLGLAIRIRRDREPT